MSKWINNFIELDSLVSIFLEIVLTFLFFCFRSILAAFYNNKDENWESDSQKVELYKELGVRLDWVGISDSRKKIYIKLFEIRDVPLILFLFTILQLHKLHYCKSIGKNFSNEFFLDKN